jgi:catechol 2,3-dioxygenase-like lactoylglutathione lyase family enzyme
VTTTVLGPQPSINHLTVLVRDIEASARWWRDVFGMQEHTRHQASEIDGNERSVTIVLEAGEFQLLLVSAPDAPPSLSAFVSIDDSINRSGYMNAGIEVDDAYETMRVLLERGVTVQKHTRAETPDARMVFFWDLEGNFFQVFSGRTAVGTTTREVGAR